MTDMLIVIIVIISLLLAISVSYSFMLKKDIGELDKTLSQICKSNTNLQLTTSTFDKNISKLAGAVNDILEKQKAIRRKSEKANDELRQAITNISHDLRTPLTSVMGYIQMMGSDKTPENKKVEYLCIIESRLKVLSALMDELFEFTQIVEGHTALHMGKVNICNPMMDVISTFYDDFIAKQIVPQIDIPGNAVYAYCDVNALKRIAQNLLRNVLVHGDGNFRISIQADEPAIVFENSAADADNLDAERLFERFYTSDASRTRKHTGLGLAITKELTERMDGEITVQIKGKILLIKIRLRPI